MKLYFLLVRVVKEPTWMYFLFIFSTQCTGSPKLRLKQKNLLFNPSPLKTLVICNHTTIKERLKNVIKCATVRVV